MSRISASLTLRALFATLVNHVNDLLDHAERYRGADAVIIYASFVAMIACLAGISLGWYVLMTHLLSAYFVSGASVVGCIS